MRTALFWVIAQTVVVISYWLFGTTYLPHLQGLNAEDGTDRLFRTLVINYHYSQRNNPNSTVLKIRLLVYDIPWTQLLCTVNQMLQESATQSVKGWIHLQGNHSLGDRAGWLSSTMHWIFFFYIYLLACSITLMISNTTCYLCLVFTIIVSLLLFVYFVFVLRFLPC